MTGPVLRPLVRLLPVQRLRELLLRPVLPLVNVKEFMVQLDAEEGITVRPDAREMLEQARRETASP